MIPVDQPWRHHYLSTACLHGVCSDCEIDTRRYDGTWKKAASCKYCRTKCSCACHAKGAAPAADEPTT